MEDLPALLMDTDIVSLMGRRKAPPGLRQWLIKVGIQRLAISYPVIAELMRGAHLRVRDNPAKALEITTWANEVMSSGFPFPAMTAEVARVYAAMTSVPGLRHMWTVQEGQKSNRLGHDLSIAAVSIAHRLPIITANVQDYLAIHELFPIPGIYHPMQGRWFVRAPFEVPLPHFDPDAPDPDLVTLPVLQSRPADEEASDSSVSK